MSDEKKGKGRILHWRGLHVHLHMHIDEKPANEAITLDVMDPWTVEPLYCYKHAEKSDTSTVSKDWLHASETAATWVIFDAVWFCRVYKRLLILSTKYSKRSSFQLLLISFSTFFFPWTNNPRSNDAILVILALLTLYNSHCQYISIVYHSNVTTCWV